MMTADVLYDTTIVQIKNNNDDGRGITDTLFTSLSLNLSHSVGLLKRKNKEINQLRLAAFV